jgi:hypothetical protein
MLEGWVNIAICTLILKIQAMFSNLFSKKDSVENIINYAIDTFIEKYEEMIAMEDGTDLIYNILFEKTKDDILACQLIVFIPIALTREVCTEYKDKFADYYTRNSGNGVSKQIKYNDHKVYLDILKVVQNRIERMEEEDMYKILEWSSEFKIIDHVEREGMTLNEISPLAMGDI